MAKAESDIAELDMQMKAIIIEGNRINADISELSRQTVNTESAINEINRIIRTSGFQGFRLHAKADVPNTYEVIRPDGRIAEKII